MKKIIAFTLSEILIVLVVIGIIAAFAIPSLMKAKINAKHKTLYKKAVNTIVNLTAGARLTGSLPGRNTEESRVKLFDALIKNLNVKGYVLAKDGSALNSGHRANGSDFVSEIPEISSGSEISKADYWIITEDNIAYLVTKGGNFANTNCATRFDIINMQHNLGETATNDALASNSCFVIYVDINGLSSFPNVISDNALREAAEISYAETDQYPIYVGIDGATAGDPTLTLTGAILKN